MATETPQPEKKKAPLPKVVTLNKALKLVSSAYSDPRFLLLFLPSGAWFPPSVVFHGSIGFVDAATNLLDAIELGGKIEITHPRLLLTAASHLRPIRT